MNVLIDFPHGLGDCVQFSVVLKHLRKYRPSWVIDVRLGRGKHTALLGQCRRVYHDQEEHPPRESYDSYLSLGWYENYNNYTDKTCTKVTNCLHEVFGLDYDPSLGRYEVAVSNRARGCASRYLRSTGAVNDEQGKFNVVLIHYEGNTSSGKKNLGHWQARAFIDVVLKGGYIPIVLDWDRRSPLPDGKTIFCPAVSTEDCWGGFGSGDAETIAAMISLAKCYVGIDSGPDKIASTTETPTLICWKGHHPIQFHDPAPNTIHAVPETHARIPPACDQKGIVEYFEKHYEYITYSGEHGLVAVVQRWLAGQLGVEDVESLTGVQFVLPNGIGDVMWALTKIQGVAASRPIDIILSGHAGKEVDRRAVPFLEHFPFVREVVVSDLPVLQSKEQPTNSRGRYNYVADGQVGQYHYLIPNAVLESGRRLEDWLPAIECNWNVIDDFTWEGTERGDELGKGLDPFVCFYLGPEAGNTSEGHNRNWLWEPRHWLELGRAMAERKMRVVVVGAGYDRSFWERYVQAGVKEDGQHWIDVIGKLEIGETFALLRRAKCFISYQCGLGIVGHYMGVRVAMWWRGEGDSAHEKHLVSFSEAMKDAWVRPGWEDRYMGLVYKKQSPADIVAEIDRREWLK